MLSRKTIVNDFKKNKMKYLMVLPVVIYLLLMCYKPMYGLIIAFQRYRPALGFKSPWVGFYNFTRFLEDINFWRVFKNTLLISFYNILFTFPAPIILALLLNEVKCSWFKRTVQTVTYLPHFVAMVVVCGLVHQFCQSDGLINDVIALFGGERTNLLIKDEMFYPIYILSDIWKEIGWSSIIYLATLAGLDQEQYEAAKIDGESRLKQMRFITLPGLTPTISMLLILKIGQVLSVGREKILLLYNEMTYDVADVVSTNVYRKGLLDADYSYSTAIGLFDSIINIILLVTANKISKKLGQSGLF